MKDLFEVGIVFRGFILTKYKFREFENNPQEDNDQDLRGAFISAINTFADKAFINTSLEYLEMDKYLCIFKIRSIKPKMSKDNEPLIIYGITESQRKPDKYVEKFFEKVNPIIEQFTVTYQGADFTELNQFDSFKRELKEYFA
jgi:hypothetical protein